MCIVFNGTYYLADRSNAGVHVILLSNDTQTKLITGFHTGLINGTASSTISGPNGLVVLPDRNELYVGDGDGSVKVISLLTNTIIANISTGFHTRADEMAYDPTAKIVVVTNPSETLITASIINVTSRTILGNISFPGAIALEQPAFNPSDGKFYLSVPSSKTYPSGALAVLNATALSIAKFIPVPSCLNAGIAFGTPNHVFLGCTQMQLKTFGFAASYIMDVTTGSIVANISGVSGSDQVTYSSSTGWYYAAAFQDMFANGTARPSLAVVAGNGTLLQMIGTDDTVAHSVAVDAGTGTLVVPVKGKGIQVYKLIASGAGSGLSATGTSSSGSSTATSGGKELAINALALLVAGIVWAVLL
jgi:DNA-binding beta-propeller fold protein YncE